MHMQVGSTLRVYLASSVLSCSPMSVRMGARNTAGSFAWLTALPSSENTDTIGRLVCTRIDERIQGRASGDGGIIYQQ